MYEWHRILKKVVRDGVVRPDRTGVGTRSLFGEQLKFNNLGSFPAVTTKFLGMGQVCAELSCFIKGYDDLRAFEAEGCKIWTANGNAEYWLPRARFQGDLGRIYGVQWRDWRSVDGNTDMVRTDQLADLVAGIKRDPHGRRHLVTAWNPGELDQVCLPPCHVLFQCYVADGQLDLRVDMRSVDLFLGLPFDIASYAVLQRLLARECGLRSGYLTFQLGDAHVYLNHLDQVDLVLSRKPHKPPGFELLEGNGLFDFDPSLVALVNYEHCGAVSAVMNV